MSLSGFGDLSHRMDRLAREMGGQAQAARLKKVGVLSKTDINAAVRNDLGDLSMSGWRRGNPHEVVGRFDVLSDSAIVMAPSRKGAGPMRVLESGRHMGQSAAMQGPGVSKNGTTSRTKSGGLRKVRTSRARRWNGATRGKHTWDDAVKIMVREIPERARIELGKAYGATFKGR